MSFPHLHLLVYLLDVVISDILQNSEKNLITSEALAVLLYPSCSGQETLSVAVAAAARKPSNRRNFHGVFQGSKIDDSDSMLNAAARNGARCMQMWEFLMDNREALTGGWRKNIRRTLTAQKRSTKEIINFVAGERHSLNNDKRDNAPACTNEVKGAISPRDPIIAAQDIADFHTISDARTTILCPDSRSLGANHVATIYPNDMHSRQEEQKQLRLKASLSTPTASSIPIDTSMSPKKGFFARLRTTSMTSRNSVPPVQPSHLPSSNGELPEQAGQRLRQRQNMKPPSFRARAAAERVIKRRSADLSSKKAPENEKPSASDWMKKTYKVAFNRQPNE